MNFSKKKLDTPKWLGSLRFRYAVKDDLTAMEWGGEYLRYRRLYRDIWKSSLQGYALLWVVEAGEFGLIGQLFVQLKSARRELADGETRAYIYGFRIMPQYRGFGVGSCLMSLVERDLYHRGFRTIALNVNRDNPKAKRLYERLGYQVTAAEAGKWSYIDHRGIRQYVNEPAWRMQKNLNGGVEKRC
jgi:ribosomal protein S18 acetylase RimI-like enzyme